MVTGAIGAGSFRARVCSRRSGFLKQLLPCLRIISARSREAARIFLEPGLGGVTIREDRAGDCGGTGDRQTETLARNRIA